MFPHWFSEARMMKLVDFLQGFWSWSLAKENQSLHGEEFHGGKIHIITKMNSTISYSKQSFEQEMSSNMFDDKILNWELIGNHPHGLRAWFEISEDRTLDSETKMTLFDQNSTYECKWLEMNFDDFGEILTNPVGTNMRETRKTKPFRQTMACP